MTGLGNINIYFGKVVDINDPLKLLRCRVSINGMTNDIDVDKLPWYFAWYGIDHLPQLGDIVPVMIFDGALQSGMYNKPLNDKTGYDELSDTDYNRMLLLYQREGVKLGYKPSTGIELLNADSAININEKMIQLFSGSQSITMTDSQIKIGSNAEQYSLMGDNVIDLLKDICDIVGEIIKQFMMPNPTMSALMSGVATPYTAPLLGFYTALTTNMTTLYTSLVGVKMSVDPEILQSKITLIE